jgi:hypothetical protein
MADIEQLHRPDESTERSKRLAFSIRAHEIEGNPLSAEQIEMFERFERQGLSDEQRRAILTERAQKLALG